MVFSIFSTHPPHILPTLCSASHQEKYPIGFSFKFYQEIIVQADSISNNAQKQSLYETWIVIIHVEPPCMKLTDVKILEKKPSRIRSDNPKSKREL